MWTTFLEVLGLLLVIAAAYLFGGLAVALLVAGLSCLALSWSIERSSGGDGS